METTDQDKRESGQEVVVEKQVADPVQPPPGDEAYAGAFDEAAAQDEGGEHKETPPSPDPAKEKSPPASATEPDPTKQPPPSSDKPNQDDASFEQKWKTLQGIHQKDKSTWDTEKAQLTARIQALESAAAAPPKKEAKQEDPPDDLTEQEKSLLKEYDEEFDTVSKMEGLKRDKAMRKLEKKIESLQATIEERISGQERKLAPVIQQSAEQSAANHFSAIRSAHSDFETLRDDGSIKSWIEAKPSFIRKALMEAYTNGETQDVIDLITQYKTENNIPSRDLNNAEHHDTPPSDATRKKEEKKAALTGINSRKPAIAPKAGTADDYESAFDEAMRKAG